MTVGPLRRAAGILGLLALVPTAVMLATGALAPQEAAMRAVAVLVAVVVVGHAARAALTGLIQRFERRVVAPATASVGTASAEGVSPEVPGAGGAERRGG